MFSDLFLRLREEAVLLDLRADLLVYIVCRGVDMRVAAQRRKRMNKGFFSATPSEV